MNGRLPLLDVSGLSLERGGRVLFDDLSFRLEAGQLLLLRGANGAGKSSLLLALAGILRPLAGRISRDEEVPLHLLGHGRGVKSRLTLTENLAFWQAMNGKTGTGPAEALERVGLGGLDDIEAGHLSAGQTRRLGLARLLVTNRPIWLLDEPTAALDDRGAALVEELIAGHCAAGGAVLAATHHDLACASATLVLGEAI